MHTANAPIPRQPTLTGTATSTRTSTPTRAAYMLRCEKQQCIYNAGSACSRCIPRHSQREGGNAIKNRIQRRPWGYRMVIAIRRCLCECSWQHLEQCSFICSRKLSLGDHFGFDGAWRDHSLGSVWVIYAKKAWSLKTCEVCLLLEVRCLLLDISYKYWIWYTNVTVLAIYTISLTWLGCQFD